MKTKEEIYQEIIELKLEVKSIQKITDNPETDYDVWKSLNLDLIECTIKIETLEGVLIKD